MSALNDKLVYLNTGDKNVYASIKTFIERKKQSSENTASTYLRHIVDFFQTMRGKSLEQLTEDDLVFTKQEIENYQVALRKNYKASTVNNTIASLKSLYSKLQDYGFQVDPNWFQLERYKDFDKQPHDVLTHKEVIQILELLGKKGQKGRRNREKLKKQVLVKVAYSTAFRLSAILDLKWTDLQKVNGYWTLHALDKGNKHDIKKISDNLYENLMKLKETTTSEKIFSMSKKTINKMMSYIRDNIDFGNRKITFHSFKKASITRMGELSQGNIKMMQRHGNHASSSTTLDNYVKSIDIDDMLVIDVNHNIDLSVLEDMSKDELVNLIKSMDRSTQLKLLQKISI